MVGRAAFGVASQAALRRLHEYYRDGRHAIASAPTSATTLDVPSSLTSGTGSMPLATATATATATHEYAAGTRTTRPHTDPRNTWHALQRELDLKLSAVTPAIDLLEMVAVRGVGRSVLEPVMAMAGEVRGEVERLARGVVAASGAATTRRASVSGTASGTDATTSIADAMARVSLDSEPPTSTSARRRSIAVGKGFDTDTRNADEEILQA